MKFNNLILKCLLFISGCLINNESTFCQEFIPSNFSNYFFTPQNMGLSTPQVTDMIKYGSQGVNYYNGLLDTNIPLGAYKDNDFDIPVSLKYISSGFVPSKRPTLVGHNWILNFGGVISRRVNGSPDDTRGYYENSGGRKYLKDGLLVAVRNQSFKNYPEENLLSFNVDKNKGGHNTPYVAGDFKHDLEPDIFHFSFGIHHGSFLIGNSGSVVFLSGDQQYKISIDNLSIQEYNTTEPPKSSSIVITTPEGYIYEFGGEVEFLEYFIPNNPKEVAVRPRYITSWHLKSIKSPNNRKANFKYNTVLQPYRYNNFTYNYSSTETYTYCPDPRNDWTTQMDSKQIEMTDNIYTPIINEVEIDGDVRMKFEIKDQNPFYDGNDSPSKSLSSIKFYYKKNQIKELVFNYINKKGYFFLSSLKNNDGSEYHFDYNLTKELPSPLTTSVDHWGFWGGGNTIKENNSAAYCINIELNRSVNSEFADITLLKKITYPTGGYTEVEYEPNFYNKYHTRDLQKIHLNLMDSDKNTLCGGARVKSLKDFDFTDKTYHSRIFSYNKPNNVKGSGIIGLKPKYRIDETIQYYSSLGGYWVNGQYVMCKFAPRVTTDHITISANSFGSNQLLEEYHIGYTDVIEKFEDGSYNHYNYSSYLDTPDKEDVTYYINGTSQSTSLNNVKLAEKHNLYRVNDMSRYRGQLLSKTVYSKSGTPVQTSSFLYNIEDATKSYNISLVSASRGNASYKIYLKPCLLKQEKVTDSNNNIITKKYFYNKQNQISTQEISNSDSIFWQINYQYLTDYDSSSSRVLAVKELMKKNMISSPFFILKTIKNPFDRTILVTDAITYDYKIENDLPLIYNIYKLDTSTPVAEGSSGFSSNLKIRETYHKYDSYGNPIYISKDDATKVVYLWGYEGQYPIAEIKNATYDQILNVLGEFTLRKLSNGFELFSAGGLLHKRFITDSEINTELDRLRTSPLLAHALVTSYTYKPLIGMLTMTDPRGLITYYNYDDFGRLKETYIIENEVKKIIQANDYHYQNQ